MAVFSIPRQYQDGLRALGTMSSDDADRLCSALCEAPAFKPFWQLREMVAQALPESGEDGAQNLLNALFGLRTQLRVRGTTAEDFATVVASSPDLGLEPDAQARLAELMSRLLSCEAISTSASAAELTIQHERPFRAVRIISDIRPIFGDDVAEVPQGAVVLHSLTLSFWTPNGQRDAVEVVLDQGDLTELGQVVERAKNKAETLRRMLVESGLVPFDLEGGSS